MTNEVTQSPKPKKKFTNKTSKYGENKGVFGKQENNNKMGIRKKFTEDNNQKSRKTPEKNSSFEASRRKFAEKRGNFESNFDKNSKSFDKRSNGKIEFEKNFEKEKKFTAKKAVKIQSLEKKKKNFEEEEESILRIERKNLLMKTKKKFGRKKKLDEGDDDDNDDSIEAKPKRKKRVIKIDPYDFSNKRLDDGNALKEITNQKEKEKKKKEEEEEKGKLSANAQFRAIKPSPSILTFVEDNFLGRRRDIELRRAGYDTELSAPLDNIPFLTTSERARIEENVFRNRLEFFAAAKVSSSFPPPGVPEIAFAGRSNVGKSSLLNSLTRQWGVVRTSDKPGHTQSINFFNLGTKVNLVDLPGYGFAYAKEEVKEAWEDLVKEYVSTRIGLKRVCLLIDTKWGMKPRDHELIHLMERHQTKYQVVLTKTDTVFPIDVARRAMQIEETLKAHKSIVQPVMMVSSKSGAGIRCLRTALAKIARFVKP